MGDGFNQTDYRDHLEFFGLILLGHLNEAKRLSSIKLDTSRALQLVRYPQTLSGLNLWHFYFILLSFEKQIFYILPIFIGVLLTM